MPPPSTSINYTKHLKHTLHTDEQSITYRQLSRSLGVHVNVAKEMLYEFHRGGKGGGCSATYVLSGLRRKEAGVGGVGSAASTSSASPSGGKDEDGDEVMGDGDGGSASQMESTQGSGGGSEGGDGSGGSGSGERGVVRSIVLVSEEKLEETRKSFLVLSSIHIYSLSPAPVKDLLCLADNSLDVQRQDAAVEDPQELGRRFGSIVNVTATRRVGPRGVAYPTAPPPPPPQPKKEFTAAGIASKTAAIKWMLMVMMRMWMLMSRRRSRRRRRRSQ
ncbi:DNA polymerase subunit Cdc27-domain-containing protein [Peziza echinospora]|nr:DNA polymerase subunit Cdc27-domain-containing protein [Peziza echinospora]